MNYYEEKLNAGTLEACYSAAPIRVRQHLEAEINFVNSRLKSSDIVLELGCGYGRALFKMAPYANYLVGVDKSEENLHYAENLNSSYTNCEFFHMDAGNLEFSDNEFDVVVCIQNGICAFGTDQKQLLAEAVRVARNRGKIIFSSYADKFWIHLIEWYTLQGEMVGIGEIDLDASTRNSCIINKDGFKISNLNENGFRKLCDETGLQYQISEIDDSLVFCEITKI